MPLPSGRRWIANRLPTAAGQAALCAVLADLLIYAIAAFAWQVPNGFPMLNAFSIVVAASLGALLAGAGLAVLLHVTRRAIPLFQGAAAVITLFSLGGPLQAMAGAMPGVPAASTATGITMIVMHVITGVILTGVLSIAGRRPRETP